MPPARYWFTTHWPHPAVPAEDVPYFVYLQPAYRERGNLIAAGDRVVFYETASGKPHRGKDGRLVPLKRGRQAVIGTAVVAAPLRRNSTALPLAEYEDGTSKDWGSEAPCRDHEWGRPVPYGEVLEVLGRGTVRIPGGLLEIDQARFGEFRRRLGLPV